MNLADSAEAGTSVEGEVARVRGLEVDADAVPCGQVETDVEQAPPETGASVLFPHGEMAQVPVGLWGPPPDDFAEDAHGAEGMVGRHAHECGGDADR